MQTKYQIPYFWEKDMSATDVHLRNGVYKMLINHSRLTEKWAMKPYTKSKFVPHGAAGAH